MLVPQNAAQARRAASVGQSGEASPDTQLFELYCKHWPEFGALLPTGAGFSVPLLCGVTSAYLRSPVRLVVVGQQTRHWLREPELMGPWSKAHFFPRTDAPKVIQKLMLLYALFLASGLDKGRGFFRAARQIQRAVDLSSGTGDAFLWRNLFICDQNGREPAEEYHDRLRKLSPLAAELRILHPHVVVFMTGQRFDFTLRAALGQDALSAYSAKYEERYLARVTIPQSSAIGLRIPHPRNPRHATWVREAIKVIECELKARLD